MTEERPIKLIVLGECGVGKTTLIHQFYGKTGSTEPTITIDRLQVSRVINGTQVHFELWDTTGRETFRSITRNFFRQVAGVLLVYDVTDMSSFLKLSSWLLELKSKNNNAICFIVGNKLDDSNILDVCANQARTFAEEEQLKLHYCSAQTGENVNEIFERLALQILEHRQTEQELKSSEDSTLATYNVIPPTSSANYPDASSIALHKLMGLSNKTIFMAALAVGVITLMVICGVKK